MNRDNDINSDSYWNKRFSEDWEYHGGPAQSRFFARLSIENLPNWLVKTIKNEKLSLVDWGCAQGDGTSEWCSEISATQITGVDFSEIAISEAKERYPSINFINKDWLSEAPSEKCDVLFSSNTLEHFHKPYDVLEKICRVSEKAIVLALPYREQDRISEHFYTFSPDNIPLVLGNGFKLVWSKVIDCRNIPSSLWIGEQVILVYAAPFWVDAYNLHLENSSIQDSDYEEKIRRLEASVNQLKAKAGNTEKELRLVTKSLNDAAEERDQLRSSYSDLVLHIEAMKGSLSWRLTKPLRVMAERVNKARGTAGRG